MLINFGLDLVHGKEVEGSIWSLTDIRIHVCKKGKNFVRHVK